MKSNVGAFDGFFRTLLFVLSLCYAILSGAWWVAVIGAILFATAIITWCPIYETTGVNTNPKR